MACNWKYSDPIGLCMMTLLVAAPLICACSRPSIAAPATSQAVPLVGDESLLAERYVEAGLPSYDRDWSGEDMTLAATALQKLVATHPEQLPRFRSDRSGKVFARITSPENLAFFRNRSLPIDTRMQQVSEYIGGLNGIAKLYIGAFIGKGVSDDDAIEMVGALLRLSQTTLDVTAEFVPTLSKDDPKYPVRMAGLDKMRRGLAQVVVGALISLTEDKAYSLQARSRLVSHCSETLPGIVSELSPPNRAEILQRLDALAADPKLADLRPQLTSLRDSVRKTVADHDSR